MASATVKTFQPKAVAPRQSLAELLTAAKAESRQQVNDYVAQVESLITAGRDLTAQGDMLPPGIIENIERLERALDAARANVQSLALKNL